VTRDISEFTPAKENFFVTNIKMNKGIQCRFGMRGVIAEAHYDGGRNMVAMLKGAKRCDTWFGIWFVCVCCLVATHVRAQSGAAGPRRERVAFARRVSVLSRAAPRALAVRLGRPLVHALIGVMCALLRRGWYGVRALGRGGWCGARALASLVGCRYILAPPTSCPQLEILEDRDHPSFRHSITDWSDPKVEIWRGARGCRL